MREFLYIWGIVLMFVGALGSIISGIFYLVFFSIKLTEQPEITEGYLAAFMCCASIFIIGLFLELIFKIKKPKNQNGRKDIFKGSRNKWL